MTDSATETPEEGDNEPYSPPPQTSDREYQKPGQPQSDRLPMAPRQRELVNSFKKIIAQHLQEVEGKTTGEFLEVLALELWRETRKPQP